MLSQESDGVGAWPCSGSKTPHAPVRVGPGPVVSEEAVDSSWTPLGAQCTNGYGDAMSASLDIPQFEDAAASHPWSIRALNGLGRVLPPGRPLSGEACQPLL